MIRMNKFFIAVCIVAITMPISYVAVGYDNQLTTANQLLGATAGIVAAGLGVLAVVGGGPVIAVTAAVLGAASAVLSAPSGSIRSQDFSSVSVERESIRQQAINQSHSYHGGNDPIIYPVSKVYPDKFTSRGFADSANLLAETVAKQVAFVRAWREADNKALQAESVADGYWIKLQNARAGLFASEISSLLIQLRESLSNLASQWTANGVPNTILTQDVINAGIERISTQGLPDRYISVLRDLRFLDSEISSIKNSFLGGSLVANLAGKTYPKSFIESILISSIDGAQEQYSLYAEARVSRVKISVQPRPYWMPLLLPAGKSKILLVNIYGSRSFDVKEVDQASLRFGNNAPVIKYDQWPFRFISPPSFIADVNRDGYNDLVAAFWTSESGYTCQSNVAVLIGETKRGLSFGGLDIITTSAIPKSYACKSLPFLPDFGSRYIFKNIK